MKRKHFRKCSKSLFGATKTRKSLSERCSEIIDTRNTYSQIQGLDSVRSTCIDISIKYNETNNNPLRGMIMLTQIFSLNTASHKT